MSRREAAQMHHLHLAWNSKPFPRTIRWIASSLNSSYNQLRTPCISANFFFLIAIRWREALNNITQTFAYKLRSFTLRFSICSSTIFDAYRVNWVFRINLFFLGGHSLLCLHTIIIQFTKIHFTHTHNPCWLSLDYILCDTNVFRSVFFVCQTMCS